MPSPSVVEKELTWAEAQQALTDGKKLTRVAWKSEDRIYLSAGILHLRKADGTMHTLIVSEADMLATDWTIVREH